MTLCISSGRMCRSARVQLLQLCRTSVTCRFVVRAESNMTPSTW